MKDLRKVVPPSREILRGIWLSFYDGAKIGVLGANGAGKSSLLRIMAGVDHDFQGEAWPHEGTRIGYLPQEPQLDNSKNVRENVDLAVKPIRDLLKKFEDISNKFAEPMSDDEMTKLLDNQARVQEKIDALNAWDIDRKIEIAMDALRLPPGDADVSRLSGGAKRRGAHPRQVLPRQRRGMDSRARSRRRDSLRRQLQLVARSEAHPAGAGREAGVGATANSGARAGVGADVAARTADQEQGPHPEVRGAGDGGRG